jgi:multidrug efflux pump subunit AcrB
VARVGGVNREVRVELDPDRLLALRATAADVSRQLRQVQQEASGGRADVGGAEQSVRTIATVQTAEELARSRLRSPTAAVSASTELATVSDTVAEQRSAALLNGKPVVGFEIVAQRAPAKWTSPRRARAALEKLQREHPDITITEAFNFVDPVIENFEGSMRC